MSRVTLVRRPQSGAAGCGAAPQPLSSHSGLPRWQLGTAIGAAPTGSGHRGCRRRQPRAGSYRGECALKILVAGKA